MSKWRKIKGKLLSIEHPVKTLIRMRTCAGWSKSSLGVHVFSVCFSYIYITVKTIIQGQAELNWATSWKTNKVACAPSKDSDQPGHLPSLIRVFTVRMKKAWFISYPLSAQRRLIRLGWCPGWSESLLGAHATLLVLSWGSSYLLGVLLVIVCSQTWANYGKSLKHLWS